MTIKITEEKEGAAVGVKALSLSHYVEKALKKAEYYRDVNGMVIAKVPGTSNFFAQGDSFEVARENFGNVLLALQLGYWLLGKKEVC